MEGGIETKIEGNRCAGNQELTGVLPAAARYAASVRD